MTTTLLKFRITKMTPFGIGIQDIKGRDFEDAFRRLSDTDKRKSTSIELLDSDTEEFRFIESGILLPKGIITLKELI